MGFDIADVAPLDYNFGPYGDGETHPIKEPTDKQVRRFFKNLVKEERVASEAFAATVEAQEGETDDARRARLEGDIERLEELQVEISEASRRRVLGYLSDVCSGDPSVEQLEKLPERGQVEFLRYIRTELVPKG